MTARARWALLVTVAVAVPAASAWAVPTTSFAITGAVDRPGTVALPDLQALPGQTVLVTYGTGRGPVSASFTGPALWSVLGQAGLTSKRGLARAQGAYAEAVFGSADKA